MCLLLVDFMLGLRDVLESKNENLYYTFERISKKIEPLLSTIVINFPQFTNHDIKHSETVITRLNTIVPDSLKEKLNEYEVFFLLCSALVHDIGMADLNEIKMYHGSNVDDIRENHHKRSCIFIRDYFNLVGLDDKFQGNIVGKICFGHRKENLHNVKIFPFEMAYKEYNINIVLLASFLRIADELDITFERTPRILFDNTNISDEVSKDEWEKHLSIGGVSKTYDPLIIRCDVQCESSKIHRELKNLEVKINSQLGDLPNFMHNYGDLIKELPRKFFMKIEAINYKYYDFKFTLDDNAIFNLLMGENLYESKNEAIRELLKNSVDSCRFKMETTTGNYIPEISFQLTSNNEKLIILDNGMGMDEYIIENYFTKIGRSFYKSEDFLNRNLDFHPVNELGIGFLSCFMIADKIIVETKKEGNISLKLEFDNLSNYFLVKNGMMNYSGTKITLHLKDDFKKNLKLDSILKNYARHLEFPIKVILPDTKESIKITENRFPNLFFHGDFSYDEIYDIHINEETFNADIYFFLKRYGEMYYFNRIKYNLFNYQSLSYKGIFVSDSTDLISDLFSLYCIYDVNLKKNALNLNLGRNAVILNDNYYLFKNKLEKCLCDEFSNYFMEIESIIENPKEVINNFFSGELYNLDLNYSPDIVKLIEDFYSFLCLTKDGLSFKKYNELLEYNSIANVKISYLAIGSNLNLNPIIDEVLESYLDCLNLEEGVVYLLEPDVGINKCLNHFFPNLEEYSFESLLINNPIHDLVGIEVLLGDFFDFYDHKVFLASFKNCDIKKMFIWISGELNEANFFLNRKHKFIKLMWDNQNSLSDDQKKIINGWLRSLNYNFNQNSFLKLQESILETFDQIGKLKGNVSDYLISIEELRLLELFLI